MIDPATRSSDLRRHAQRCADELLPGQLRALAERHAREALRELVVTLPVGEPRPSPARRA